MKLLDDLRSDVATEREFLMSSPIISHAMRGDISRAQYVAFLKEAYFHVKETVPLLMACGSRLPEDKEWLRGAVAHYIDDEYGHEQWILNDIRNAGGDPELIRAGQPSQATELMVAYAWDMIQRRNPVGFFGMVYVLEGTSVALATRAAQTLQTSLSLPEDAFSYLLSHGTVDLEHVKFLESILDRFDDPADCATIVHCARRFFYLYAQIFRTLPDKDTASSRPDLRLVA
jgi:pyrroloquinoline quinone (PQQ) biosynthesis protein C